jgi:hypothetical protein
MRMTPRAMAESRSMWEMLVGWVGSPSMSRGNVRLDVGVIEVEEVE